MNTIYSIVHKTRGGIIDAIHNISIDTYFACTTTLDSDKFYTLNEEVANNRRIVIVYDYNIYQLIVALQGIN